MRPDIDVLMSGRDTVQVPDGGGCVCALFQAGTVRGARGFGKPGRQLFSLISAPGGLGTVAFACAKFMFEPGKGSNPPTNLNTYGPGRICVTPHRNFVVHTGMCAREPTPGYVMLMGSHHQRWFPAQLTLHCHQNTACHWHTIKMVKRGAAGPTQLLRSAKQHMTCS